MKGDRNAFEALRETNPVRDEEVPGSDSPEARELLARIRVTPRQIGEPAHAPRRRLRHVIALAAISVFTVAATWIWVQTIRLPNAIICHQAVDLDSDTAAAPTGETATAASCAPVWEQQTLVNPNIVPPGSVPPLTACVAENGALVVLPTNETSICDRLGLARPDPGTQESADQIRQLESRLIEFFQSTECVSIDEATAHAADLAAEYGLSGWGTDAQEETPERPCASFSINPDLQTIFIIPIPHP